MAEEKYRQFFLMADTDNSGYLTVKELLDMLKKQGYHGDEATLKKLFTSVDRSNDEKVSLEEFMQSMGSQGGKVHAAAILLEVFRKFDADGNGTIDRNELKKALSELGNNISEQDLERLMLLADKDKSQSLNYEEFVKEIYR